MKKLKIVSQFKYRFIIIFLFLLIYVWIRTIVISYSSHYSIDDTYLEGTITYYSINGNALKMDVKGLEKVKVTYYIESEEEKNSLEKNIHLGDKVKLKGEFKEPANNTIPGTFNYKKYLYYQKIYYTFTASSLQFKSGKNIFYQIKDKLLKRVYNTPKSDYLLTFILGDKALLNSEEYGNFQVNGIAHLLAISGMHVGLFLSLLNLLFKKLNSKWRFILICIFLTFLSFLTGFSASVNRVIIFYCLVNINKFRNWQYSNLQILFLTGAILILLNPFVIYNYGFLYSFVITGGIIYYQEKITGNYLVSLLKLSTITFLFSLPITANLNYEINLTSILANLIFVPLVSYVIYPWSLITLIIPNFLWPILISVMNSLNTFFLKINLIINIPKMSLSLIVLYYLVLILMKNRWKMIGLIISIVVISKVMPKLDNNYYVYMIDVGQGDCAILVSPHKKEAIMIDTGGKISYKKEAWEESSKSYNLSDNVIKFLKSEGITKLNYLLITHGDSDHMKEAINIVNSIKVNTVIFNIGKFNALEKELIEVLEVKNINYFQNPNKLDFNNNPLYILNTRTYDNENDNSNVLYFILNNYKFLFMGDAGVEKEKDILNKYKIDNVDFLKVGHHGSDTSSGEYFIDNINPKNCLISVGLNNRYGHPKKSVLDVLNKCDIYRTDIDGTMKIKINKNGYKIKTYQP